MHPAAPNHLLDRLVPLVLAIVIAAPVTYLEVAHPSWESLATATQTIVHRLPHSQPAAPKAAPPATTASSSTTASTTKPAAAPPAPVVKTALTNTYVHLRSAKSVTSTIITDLNAGTTVQLRDDADTTWQGVTYQGKSGYIYRAYLQY